MKHILPILLGLSLGIGGTEAGETNAVRTLTLVDAENLALKNHPQIAAANYRALAAQEAIVESRSGFFPNVNLYGTAAGANTEGARIMAGSLNNPSVFSRVAGGLQINQLLTDFGRTANLTASSEYQAKAEGQNLELTREQVLLQVDTTYYSTLEAQAVLRVARQTFDTRQLLLDQVTALATNKLRSELDVSFAQVELQQARLLMEKSQDDADAASATLSTALGYREYHEFRLVDSHGSGPPANAVTNDVSDLIQTALSHRPELLSLRDERDSALRQAKAERDARLPQIAAVGVAGDAPVHDSHLPDDYAAGGVQLSLPLFAGGFYTARQREAELKAQSDDELLRSAEDNVIRDVRVAWLNFNNAIEQLQTTEELVRNA
ncbi:MAG TPA: TolC family protein, partial [Candidatus Acidoferrales bacterium]|nr:TolC family protein [Candidatus Acidoferrales bacterium]